MCVHSFAVSRLNLGRRLVQKLWNASRGRCRDRNSGKSPQTKHSQLAWWLRAITIATTIVVVISACEKMISSPLAHGDMEAYLHGAQAIMNGEDIYAEPSRPLEMGGLFYIYPPLLAVAFVPLAIIPVPAAVIIWTLFNVLLLAWILNTFYGLIAGSPLSVCSPVERWILIVCSLIPVSRYIIHHLSYGQANILLMALVVLGIAKINSGQRFMGGFAIGLSVAVKVISFPIVLWLALKRRIIPVSGALTGCAFGLLVPAIFVGFSRNWNYLMWWFKNVISYDDLGSHAVPLTVNVSVQALLHGHLGDQSPLAGDEVLRYFALAATRDDVLRSLEILSVLVMIGLMIVFAYRFRNASDFVSYWGGISLTFCLTPIFMPVAQKHYLVLLLPTFIYIVYVWTFVRLNDVYFRGLSIGSFILLFFTSDIFVSDDMESFLNAFGVLVWASCLAAIAVFRAGHCLSSGDKQLPSRDRPCVPQ